MDSMHHACIWYKTMNNKVDLFFSLILVSMWQTNGEYGARAFIWGWADPGEKVSIVARGTPYQINADKNGK